MNGLTTTVSGRMTQARHIAEWSVIAVGRRSHYGRRFGVDPAQFLGIVLVRHTGRVDRNERDIWNDEQLDRHVRQHRPDNRNHFGGDGIVLVRHAGRVDRNERDIWNDEWLGGHVGQHRPDNRDHSG